MEFEMVKFDVKEAEIAKMKMEYMALKITGLNDVAGYTLVHQALMTMVHLRTDITKAGKAWRDQVNVHINNELTEEKRLLGLLKPIETHLEKEKFAIDDEKKRIKAAAEEQEKKRVQSRINRLFAFGCKFDGIKYSYGDILMASDSVRDVSDDDFNAGCAKIEILINAEIAEQEEELRKRQEEDKRQAAERDRLAAIARDQAALFADMKAEADRIAMEQAEKETIIKRDQERREAKIKADADKVEADRRKLDEDKRLEVAKKEAAEKARIEFNAQIKREAEEADLRKHHAKMEAERQEALKPDKKKLQEWANQISNLSTPDLKSKEAVKITYTVVEMLDNVAEFIITEVKKL